MITNYPGHGGNLVWAKEYYCQEELIDFSANINPLGCSTAVYQEIINQISQILNYPDPECTELKRELSIYYGISEDYLLLGNGASELLYLICHAILPRKVLILAPSFSEYARAAKACGASVEEIILSEENQFKFELSQLDKKIKSSDLFFICNPNNPVGNIYPKHTMERIAELCLEYRTILVIDESFMDFVLAKEDFSMLSNIKNTQYLIILNSLTKFYALPGLRLGCCITNKKLINKLVSLKDPWNINCFAQLAGIKSIQDKDFQIKTKNYIAKEKDDLFSQINAIPIFQAYYPSVNFILIKVMDSNLNSTKLTTLLAKKGILVRNCNTFSGLKENYIRVAVRTKEDNNKLIKALMEIYESGGKSD